MTAEICRSVLLGLIGDGIGASRSPMLHEREAALHGLPLVYRLLDFRQLGLGAADLGAVLGEAQKYGFDGFNVTHPYKAAVIPLLDTVSEQGRDIGAVNTIVLRGRSRAGHNTDWYGFAESVRRALPQANLRRVAQIGAGGAGAATAYALLQLGAERLSIHDIDGARAGALADRLTRLFPGRKILQASSMEQALHDADGLVQATPIGMSGHPGMPVDPALLSPRLWVADVIYTPLETQLVAQARALGCLTIPGGDMVIFQAAMAFELFTGIRPDVQRMMRSFESCAV